MNRKELTKTFMIIFENDDDELKKTPLFSMIYTE